MLKQATVLFFWNTRGYGLAFRSFWWVRLLCFPFWKSQPNSHGDRKASNKYQPPQ